jgi:hypothetical protein
MRQNFPPYGCMAEAGDRAVQICGAKCFRKMGR